MPEPRPGTLSPSRVSAEHPPELDLLFITAIPPISQLSPMAERYWGERYYCVTGSICSPSPTGRD
ncbi:hypothetical protein NicSoilB8_07510 [Arthrobacter sp. NicSoilB8]|nr:hypothetical protein NicSoilB8_07510 [Arthrobacter sp. NicSoilB8]